MSIRRNWTETPRLAARHPVTRDRFTEIESMSFKQVFFWAALVVLGLVLSPIVYSAYSGPESGSNWVATDEQGATFYGGTPAAQTCSTDPNELAE
jgi:hypothetical protein